MKKDAEENLQKLVNMVDSGEVHLNVDDSESEEKKVENALAEFERLKKLTEYERQESLKAYPVDDGGADKKPHQSSMHLDTDGKVLSQRAQSNVLLDMWLSKKWNVIEDRSKQSEFSGRIDNYIPYEGEELSTGVNNKERQSTQHNNNRPFNRGQGRGGNEYNGKRSKHDSNRENNKRSKHDISGKPGSKSKAYHGLKK
eukprot:Awhi_evm1s1836